MPWAGESLASPESVALQTFRQYSIDVKARLNEADYTLGEGLGLIADLGRVNDQLTELGRPDLVIGERAKLAVVTNPGDVTSLACNNFSPDFVMRTGVRKTDEWDWRSDKPEYEAIPPTHEDLMALKHAPKLEDYDDIGKHWKEFPILKDANHSVKPVFIRMLLLFPDFTSRLVRDMSQPENQNKFRAFEPELYVAYQLMSRLVDITDISVTNENGSVKSSYLFI